MKRKSTALLLIMALAAVPTLSTAAPLDCRVRPLTDAQYLALDESFLEWQEEEPRAEEVLPASPPLPWMTTDGYTPDVKGYTPDVKMGVVAPFGVEIVEPPGCPEISGSH